MYDLLRCPVCGKKFIPAAFHQYRIQQGLVCSYNCQMKGMNTDAEKRRKAEILRELKGS